MANPFDQFDPPAAPLDPRKPARAPSQSGNPFYDAVRDAVSPLGGRITSTNGGRHNVGSEHYSGRAVDVGMGRETPEQQESIKSALEAAGYRVRDERSRPAGQAVWSGPHLHVSMDGGGSGGGGAMGAADANPFAQPSAQGGNPFDQFDGPAEDPVAAFRQINAARQPAAPASQPAPDFGNIVGGFSTSESPAPAAPTSDQRYRPGSFVGKVIASLSNAVPGGGLLSDETIKAADGYAGFDPSTTTGIPEAPALQRGDYVDMGLRSIVRVPDLAGSLIDLIPDAGDAAVRALGGSPEKSVSLSLMRHGLGFVSDAAHQPTRMADEMGFGLPSVDAGQALDAVDPRTNIPVGDRLSSLARFIPETLVGSGGDMAAAVSAPYLYMGARTDEIARNRAANDKRANVSATDLAAAAPAAAIETMLEKFTTGRLLPGGGAHLPASTLAEALTRVAKETGLQAASGGVEEVVPYLAENAGTQTGANARDALAQAFGGALSEGALGAAVDAPSQLASLARPKPKANVSPEAQAPTEQQAVNPARVAAEKPVEAAPRPEPAVAPTAKAAPQTAAAEAPPAESTRAAPSRPDMDAATKAIDTRLAALDESARAALPESKVSELNAERQQLDDLVREQDRAKREGIILSPENRLTADERAQADTRRAEIAAELERHRAARSAADQAERLRNRLDNADTDAGLFEVAREIDPTLGTTQAETFRASAVKEESAPKTQSSPPAAIATPSVSEAGSTTPLPDTPSVAAQGHASTSRTEPQQNQDVLSKSLNQKEITTQKASQKAPDVADQRGASPGATVHAPEVAPTASEPVRAEAPRQSMGETGDLRNSSNPAPRPESQREPAPPSAPEAPARTTSLKNAVTDAERVAEGRDPIIREARKANRKTVDEAVSAIRENPSIGRETAQRLAEGGPVELKDEAVLLVHKVDLRKRRDAAAERAQDPNASEQARAIARREYDDAVQQIDEVDQAASRIGTESGRLLQLRKRMIAEDYSLPALERKLRMVVNRDLKPAERAELAEMAEKVAMLQRKLDAAESQQAKAQVDEMLSRLMSPRGRRRSTLAAMREDASASLDSLLSPQRDPNAAGAQNEQLSVRAALDAALQTGSAADLARRIGEDASLSEDQRDLGQRLAPVLDRLGVKLVQAPADAKYAGIYDNAENSLWVHQANAETVLHEAVHGVTSALITSREAKTNPEVRRLVGELNDMLDHLRMQVAFGDVSMPADVRRMLDDPQGPLSNPKELLAYGMTEKPLQEWLATLPPPPGREAARSVWQAFKDAVSRMVAKVTGAKRSYLDALIESGGGLIDVAGSNPDVARTAQREVSARFRLVDPAAMKDSPEALFHLSRIGAFHYADGAKDIGEWTKRMEADLGPAADRYRSMLPAAFKAAAAQAERVTAKGPETVAEAIEAIGDQRRPRDVKRVVRAVVAEGARGADAIIGEAARALDMDEDAVRSLFVQTESKARTLTEAQAELKELRKALRRENSRPAQEAKAAIRRDQKEMREAQREALRPDPETRYQNQRARDFQRRIADLEERIAAGDFAKTEKTVRALDEKNTRLEFQLQKVKSEFAFYALEKEFAERAPLAKFTGYIGETFSLLRAIKTSLDLSATLMQGGMMVVNRPYLLKHLKATVKAAWSEELEYEARKRIESDPDYPRFKKLGLYLPGTDAQLEKAEEAFASRWVRKIPTKYGGGLLRASSRSYTTFLNLIRLDTFKSMEQSMSRDGKFDFEDSKALAKSINIMTGRGSLGRFEDAAGFFNIILFAARFTASRFQVLAGLPLTNTVFGGGPRARRAIRKEYARYMLGAAVFYAFYALVRDPEDWEDDKSDDDQAIDNKRFVERDPRSVNFGAVKFGDDIYVNPLSGLSQATVFMTRLATGEEKKTSTGKIVPLRDNYRLTDYAPGLGQGWDLGNVKGGKTTLGESGRFLRTKLSPAVGAGVNLMLGKNMIGDEYTWADVPADLTVPMSLGDLVDTVENQGVPRGMAINLAAFLGHGRQYRKSDAEKAAEDANGIPGKLGFGTAGEGD